MKLLSQTERPSTRGRVLQRFSRGIRRVCLGDAESWTTYLIIPRAAMIAGIRARRAAGAQYHDCDWWTLLTGLDRWIRPAGGGSPGRSFAREPVRMRSSRQYVVIVQSGGLDV